MQKSSKNDRTRLLHMLDAAKLARQFLDGKTRQAYEKDLQLQFALAHAVQIVGEAACNVTTEFQAQYPELAWKNMMGMRQVLVHTYFDLDLDVVWRTVDVHLPPLIVQLEAILSSEDKSP